MTTKDFIRKWGTGVKGDWWLKDAGRVYWAASYEMPQDELLIMSRDFMRLSNLDVYRGTSACKLAMDIVGRNSRALGLISPLSYVGSASV